MKKRGIVVLDNIRSTHNVGSIFRTADGLGFSKIYLCGTTPAPLDRFGRERKDIAKVALGAEKTVKWEYFESTVDAIKELKKEGVQIVALEQDEKSEGICEIKVKGDFALILGNEVGGIDKEILEMADVIAEIPMRGGKESFNVSVSFGIAGFVLMK